MENLTEFSQTFLNQYFRECLPNQQKRSKRRRVNQISKDDQLVWILENFYPCGLWPLSKVIEVYPGLDKIEHTGSQIKDCIW